jgi:hypothetical protein
MEKIDLTTIHLMIWHLSVQMVLDKYLDSLISQIKINIMKIISQELLLKVHRLLKKWWKLRESYRMKLFTVRLLWQVKMNFIKMNIINNNLEKTIIVSKRDQLDLMMISCTFRISKINCLQEAAKIMKIIRIMKCKYLIIKKKNQFKKRSKKHINQK